MIREQWHNLSDSSGRYEDDGAGHLGGVKLTSLRSEACLVTSGHSQSNLLEHSYTLSQNNVALLAASKVNMTVS